MTPILDRKMNATDRFEKPPGNTSLPASGEHFWTSVFAFFLLHLADTPEGKIRYWKPCSDDSPPWFEANPDIDLPVGGLTIDQLAIEPSSLHRMYSDLGQKLTGVSPDIVIYQEDPKRLCLIENKVKTGAILGSNQRSEYPSFVETLTNRNIDARLFVLMSYGCQKLFNDTKLLYKRLGDKFGIFLWEDVFRQMGEVGSGLPGLKPQELKLYCREGKEECRGWDA